MSESVFEKPDAGNERIRASFVRPKGRMALAPLEQAADLLELLQ